VSPHHAGGDNLATTVNWKTVERLSAYIGLGVLISPTLGTVRTAYEVDHCGSPQKVVGISQMNIKRYDYFH